jgi:hypothetical protein
VTDADLQQLEAKFEQRLAALQSQVDLLRQENAELRQGRGPPPGGDSSADSMGRDLAGTAGRRLNPANQRMMWHNGFLHRFDDPVSTGCGLEANLHTSSEPLMIRRDPDGNLTMKYSTGVAFITNAPMEVTHPSGCAAKTLTANADVEVIGKLTVSNNVVMNNVVSSSVAVNGRGWGNIDVAAIAEFVGFRPVKEVLSLTDLDSNPNNGVTFDAGTGAFTFVGSGTPHSSSGTLPAGTHASIVRPIAGDFTILFEFKTTQTGASGVTDWYGSIGLVDAEVGGNANDFGIGMTGGKIIVGMGSPTGSTSKVSEGSTTYNDGNWHSVRVKRKRSNGFFNFFIDGVFAGWADAANDNQDQNSPTHIDFGRIQTGYNYFTGQLRNIRFFSGQVGDAI